MCGGVSDGYCLEYDNEPPPRPFRNCLSLPLCSPLLSEYMRSQWKLAEAGFDYSIVAVFGSQSTGKSK